MKILVLGSTGLLGQALVKEIGSVGHETVGVARRAADVNLDLTNESGLKKLLLDVKPDWVINAAAVVNLKTCEEDASAWLINVGLPGMLSRWCTELSIPWVQVSTDHYFSGDEKSRHSESDSVELLNAYARQKYAAEALARVCERALVLRVNIVGYRGWGQPTFVEWALDSLHHRKPMFLFSDYFISSLDVGSCSSWILGLIEKEASGLYHLASSEIFSKADIVLSMAKKLEIDPDWVDVGPMDKLEGVKRADSLGLDVSKVQAFLGKKLPGLEEVTENLIYEYRQRT